MTLMLTRHVCVSVFTGQTTLLRHLFVPHSSFRVTITSPSNESLFCPLFVKHFQTFTNRTVRRDPSDIFIGCFLEKNKKAVMYRCFINTKQSTKQKKLPNLKPLTNHDCYHFILNVFQSFVTRPCI